ncbi:MAG TPA: hypothetical protein VK589_04370 [Chryseolinea sp.]|nr:hypothetical protein [Chryseolinea sp.]
MKKIVSATDLGGAPFFKNDMREIFNAELWDVIEGILSQHDADTQGVIISGCVLSANAANFDMTAGIVYLNGEFMRIAAATNQTFNKFIQPSTPTTESRTFADGTTHNLTETKGAELGASTPGAGQYITIANLTAPDSRRIRLMAGNISSDEVDSSIMTHEVYSPTTDVDTMFAPGIQFIIHTAANAPNATAGNKWIVLISHNENNGGFVQLAFCTVGTNAGDIFERTYASPSGPWGSWSTINT